MIIYRLAQSAFSSDLSGEGARLYGGRWNSPGRPMLYATQHISLAVLEILVNRPQTQSFRATFDLLELEIEDNSIRTIALSSLKKDWHRDISYTRFIGDHFLADPGIFVLQVPSAVIPEEFNFLINPLFKSIKVKTNRTFPLDERLRGI